MDDNLLPPKSNKDKDSAERQPAPLPSHLRPGSEVDEPPVAPPPIAPKPAKVEGKYCPYCDELISVNAIKCKHCQSMLDNMVPHSTPPPSSSIRYQGESRYGSKRQGPKGSNVGLQVLKVIGIAAVLAVGFFVYWSLPIPLGRGFVKSIDWENDNYSVFVYELDELVTVPAKNADRAYLKDDMVKVHRQQGEYYIKRDPLNWRD